MKTKSEFTASLEIDLPVTALWLKQEDHSVKASIASVDAYTQRLSHTRLEVVATSKIGIADAEEAIRDWVRFVSAKLNDEISVSE